MSNKNGKDYEPTDEELELEERREAADRDWVYSTFGDGDDHGWSQEEIEQYEDWLMSNDPSILPNGEWYD